ncbi:MAG: SPOR domain-containing protein [Planctomycetota bacterium]
MNLNRLTYWIAPLGVGLMLCFGPGCRSSAPPPTLTDANAAYERADFQAAYAYAATIARGEPSEDRASAAYVAGLSARELGRTDRAVRFLRQAAQGFDQDLAADASVTLGLIYSEQEKYALATDALLDAAPRLTGEDRAKAYFYAAVAQQKLGRWATARDHLTLARTASADPQLRQQIENQLAVTGYTLQIGSFNDFVNAQAAADQVAEQARSVGVGEPRLIPNPARPGQTLVHLGRFTTYQSAASYRAELGVPGAFVVPVATASPR